jgi:hypothetical protein
MALFDLQNVSTQDAQAKGFYNAEGQKLEDIRRN